MKELADVYASHRERFGMAVNSTFDFYAMPAFWVGAAAMAERFAAGDQRLVEILIDIAGSLEDCERQLALIAMDRIKE
jgi:hypothetical protein